ncbi:MAG: YkgJ family cysteine cluster protein [Methylococcales bacterium]
MNILTKLHEDIEARVGAIREDNPDWLCRMGCDGCCRRLAETPRFTAMEWNLLQEGLIRLSPGQLLKIGTAIAALVDQLSRPIVCPLLDRSAGVCLVYAYRPVACRTYGFYVQRDKGVYCNDIEPRVVDGDWADVVWGNQDAVDHRLRGLGDAQDLTEWFVCWKGDKGVGD